jgi:DNA-binding transcriptional ArsR family regulator
MVFEINNNINTDMGEIAARTNRGTGASPAAELLSRANLGKKKVSRRKLSPLMIEILHAIGDGIERGALVEKLYGLRRRYRGWYTDPCLRGNTKREHDRRYRNAQAVLSRTLKRLQRRGLITLVRKHEYVKAVSLTEKGRMVVNQVWSTGKDFEGEELCLVQVRLRARRISNLITPFL